MDSEAKGRRFETSQVQKIPQTMKKSIQHITNFSALITLFALFASIFTLQKMTLLHSEKFFLVGSRMFLAGIVLTIYVYVTEKQNKNIKKEHVKLLIYLTISNIYLTNIFEIYGLNFIQSSKACLLYSLSPFLSAIFGLYTMRETIGKNKIIGLCFGFFGILLSTTKIAQQNLLLLNFAELSILCAVCTSVYGWFVLKNLIELNYSPVLLNGISMLFGGVLLLIHSYVSGETWNPLPVSNYLIFARLTAITCIISNIICYNLFGLLLKKFTVTFMNFTGLLTPIFASFLGYFYLQEEITITYMISVCFLLTGMLVFYKEEKI